MRWRVLVRALATCAACTIIDVAVAAPAALPMAEAQRLAIERSPRIAAYDATVAAARGMASAVMQLPGPAARTLVDDAPVEDGDRFGLGEDADTTRRVGIARYLTSPEKRKALAERYGREAELAAARKAAVRVEIARETALAWLECYYVEQMTRIAAEQLKAMQVELEGSERMYWAGRLTQAEFYAGRAMLVMFEDKSSELDHHARSARVTLKRWVGDAGDAPLGVAPNIDRIGLRSEALEGDLGRQPEIVVLERDADLATNDVLVAQASRLAAAEIALAAARRDEARAAREERLRSEVAQTRNLIDEWQHARDRRDRYAKELVPIARERTTATLVAYRGGKGTLTDVLAARRAQTEAQMESIEMERDAARMWARLNFAISESAETVLRDRPR